MTPYSVRTVHRLCHGPNNGIWDGMACVNHVWLYVSLEIKLRVTSRLEQFQYKIFGV